MSEIIEARKLRSRPAVSPDLGRWPYTTLERWDLPGATYVTLEDDALRLLQTRLTSGKPRRLVAQPPSKHGYCSQMGSSWIQPWLRGILPQLAFHTSSTQWFSKVSQSFLQHLHKTDSATANQLLLFFGRRPLSFGGSRLRLPSGLAGFEPPPAVCQRWQDQRHTNWAHRVAWTATSCFSLSSLAETCTLIFVFGGQGGDACTWASLRVLGGVWTAFASTCHKERFFFWT